MPRPWTPLLLRLIGWGLGLALPAIAAWGAHELWTVVRLVDDSLPTGWDCSLGPSDPDPIGSWGDPCAGVLETRRAALGMASVFAAAIAVGVGLAGLLWTGRLAERSVRRWACAGVMLACVTSTSVMVKLTLLGHPLASDGLGGRQLLAVLSRETALLSSVAGMLLVAGYVLLPMGVRVEPSA